MQDIVGTPRREFYAHWRHESKVHHPKPKTHHPKKFREKGIIHE